MSRKPTTYYKCGYNPQQGGYQGHLNAYYATEVTPVEGPMEIKVLIHLLFPDGSYQPHKVDMQITKMIAALNNDFNAFGVQGANNLAYSKIIKKMFAGEQFKQRIYLERYKEFMPTSPSQITFTVAQVYPYSRVAILTQKEPVEASLHSYLEVNGAAAISPDKFLNIWVVDMDGPQLGFSSFPWDLTDQTRGIVIHRRVLLPDEVQERFYGKFKTVTHHVGHFFGLVHTSTLNSETEPVVNQHLDATSPKELQDLSDPGHRERNNSLYTNMHYNPLFMNYMDLTMDDIVVQFTPAQIERMRSCIRRFYPGMVKPAPEPPAPKVALVPKPKLTVMSDFDRQQFLNNMAEHLPPPPVIRQPPPPKPISPYSYMDYTTFHGEEDLAKRVQAAQGMTKEPWQGNPLLSNLQTHTQQFLQYDPTPAPTPQIQQQVGRWAAPTEQIQSRIQRVDQQLKYLQAGVPKQGWTK